ncbi:MAG TPA: 2-oxo-tetronate isomerase [Casimicrobiaceae bacterium]|nr:2-oxo-tetronate isomerase [Casimicrobiaceae bacterium]
MPRFSANLSFLFTEVSFLDRFEAAAKADFHAVEFAFAYDYPSREIAARLEGNGLAQVLINAPPGDYARGDRGLAAIPGREHEFAASFAAALRYAHALSCPRVHVMAGLAIAGADAVRRAQQRATFVRNLASAAREAESEGVELTIEPINPRDVPGYFLNTQSEAHAIREETAAANLKVQMDCYHAQIVEGDLSEKLRRWLAHIGHIQIAGVPGRHEPDVGEINYAYLFALLDELGYTGWVGCEYRPRAGTVEGLAWMKALVTSPIPSSARAR